VAKRVETPTIVIRGALDPIVSAANSRQATTSVGRTAPSKSCCQRPVTCRSSSSPIILPRRLRHLNTAEAERRLS